MSLGSIVVRLSMNTADFDTDSKRAASLAKRRAAEIDKAFTKAGKAIGAALGTAFVAATAAITYGVKTAINRMDDLAKSAQKVGVSTEALSKLAYAAELSGVGFDQLESALAKLAKTQDMAAQGSKEQLEYFRALGIEFENSDKTLRATDEVLADIADKFQKMPDGAGKTAAAMALIGRSGAQLIPLLNTGSSGLAAMGDELERFGGVVGPEAAKQAEQFNDDLTRMRVMLDGVWQSTATQLLPDLIRLTGEFANADEKGEGFRDTGTKIAAVISTIAETAYVAYNRIEALTNATVQLGARAAQAVLSNPLTGLGALDRLFNDGAGAREAGILAESSAARVAEANARADAGLGLGRGVFKPDAAADASVTEEGKAAAARLAEIRAEQEKLTAGRKAAADAARAQAEAERELERIMDAGKVAAEGLTQSVQQRAAELAGPAALAARAYADELMRLVVEEEKLRAAQMLNADAERELSLARTQAFEQYQQELEALEEQRLGPGKQLLDDLKFELELMKMTNAERATAIQLRGMDAEAVRLYGDEIRQANEDIEESLAQIRGQDFFRDEMKGLFTDVVSGAKSAKDAVSDFFDNLRMRAIEALAERLMDQLFGQQGTSQTGAAGGGWASWIGALFGGARAAGGPMVPGKAYLVGEEGPELVMPKAAGTVIPAGKTAAMVRGGARAGDTFVIQGATSNRAIERIRIDRERSQRRAVREMA